MMVHKPRGWVRYAGALGALLLAVNCHAGELVPGVPVRSGSGSFTVSAGRGEFVRVAITGADVEVQGPGGVLHDVDGALDYLAVVGDAGFRLEVKGATSFEIVLAERHAATEADRKRVQGFGREGEKDAVALYGEAGDRRGEALSSARLAANAMEKGDYEAAYPFIVKASERLNEVEVPSWQAAVLRRLGEAKQARGEVAEALPILERALKIERGAGDDRGIAYALNALAVVYHQRGENERALPLLREGLAIRRRLGDSGAIASGLRSLAETEADAGDDAGALAHLEESAALWKQTGNKRGEALVLHALAGLYQLEGEYEKVIASEEAGRKALRESGAKTDEPAVLNAEATAYNSLGQPERAGDLLRVSLEILKTRHEPVGESATRINLAGSERAQGHYAEMLKQCTVAVEAARKAQNPMFEGIALAGVGMAQHLTDRTAEGLATSGEALAIFRKTGFRLGQGRVLAQMGSMAVKAGKTQDAVGYLREARTILGELRSQTLEGYALYWLARAEAQSGDLAGALRDNSEALEKVEASRARIEQTDLRTSYFVTAQDYYQQQIALLIRLHQTERALEVAESARARRLLDSLEETPGGEPMADESERAVRAQLTAASARLTKTLAGPHTKAQQEAAERRVAELSAQDRQLLTKPAGAYAAALLPQPVKVAEIQRGLLGPGTQLVEYSIGDEHSYAWVVSAAGVRAFTLAGRAAVQDSERRAYAWWTGEAGASEEAVHELSRLILVPLAKELLAPRLLIVADGALAFVPFAALPDAGPNGGTREPLMAAHEIVMLPSASVLLEERASAKTRVRAGKSVAVLADPVFNASDPRVAGEVGGAVGAAGFERLRWTRVEAESIAALAPGVFRAVDFDASRASLQSAALGDYRVLHIATHSILNEKRPELSGIVLSLVDQKGRPSNGFVQAREIYDLKLRADLVVLSACETARGKEVRGEGVMSLMRAFEYAGAPRVLASIWKVPDAPTAELMKRFYQALLQKKLPAAAALHEAQLEMWKSGRWSDARNWAGFVIEGEFQ